MEKLDIYSDKIIFIYGENPIDGQVKDGQIEEIKKDTSNTIMDFHQFYLYEYLKNNFKDNQEVQDAKHPFMIMYEIQKRGHIGVIDTTVKEDEKQCMMYLPKEISKKQIVTLKDFQQQLEEQNYVITMFYNLLEKDGKMTGTSEQWKKPKDLTKYIEKYDEKYNKNQLEER